MAFRTINSWTLSGLIMAFIDLAIVYALLCGSAFAFIPSKLLSFFGLSLPCPCSGVFGYQNSDFCFHRLLIDWPRRKIIAVEELVKNRFPYDLILSEHKSCNLHPEGRGNRKFSSGVIEREACSTSLSGPALHDSVDRESGCDTKGKKIVNQRSKSGIRRRRRAALGNGKLFPALSSTSIASVGVGFVLPSYEGSGMRSTISGSLDAWSGTEDSFLGNPGDRMHSIDNNANVIQVLEQALEEEKAAHAVLYQELEIERAAAATAADEAMAMILRLQEDKASIEMEARQYQRLIEEKFAYDEEEMKILKEILVRREKEIHFLEKEVEAYEQINFLGNEQEEGDSSYSSKESRPSYFIGSNENPLPVPLQIENSKSIGEKEVAIGAKCLTQYEYNHSLAFGKEMTSTHKDPASGSSTLQRLMQKTFSTAGKEKTEKNISLISPECETPHTCSTGEELEKDGEGRNQEDCHICSSMLDIESTVYDVHVIDDKTVLWKEDHGKGNGLSSTTASFSVVQNAKFFSDFPTMGMAEIEPNVHESNFDMHGELIVSNNSLCKTFIIDSQRHSPTAVEGEGLKIDNEIEWLRERLRIVQEEKEKFTISEEHKERVNAKLNFTDDILNQLQEIQPLKKSVRPASLPPSSSKVSLERRHCRSASWEDFVSDKIVYRNQQS